MKRLLCVWMILMLLNTAAMAASTFSPDSAREAKELALECLKICGFGSEYNSSTSKLTRWEREIRIYAYGDHSTADLEALDDFIEELSWKCGRLPEIRRVSSKESANVTIYYGPLKSLSSHVRDYVEGNWGCFYYRYNDYRRTRGEIAIATDVTNQKQRNHLMMEELVGVLGLSNDHDLYTDSILYAPWTETQKLSDVDWLMLNMLYDSSVSCGMSMSRACSRLSESF